jgi:hypothetical protein
MACRDALLVWCRRNGVEWDQEQLVFSAGGVFSARDLGSGSLCRIPKALILSSKTCAVADLLEHELLGGLLSLVVSAMHESLLPNSPWREYLDTIQTNNLPVFWNKNQKKKLKNTDLHKILHTLHQDLQSDYLSEIVPLLEKYPEILKPDLMTLDLFLKMASWCTSRAFERNILN